MVVQVRVRYSFSFFRSRIGFSPSHSLFHGEVTDSSYSSAARVPTVDRPLEITRHFDTSEGEGLWQIRESFYLFFFSVGIWKNKYLNREPVFTLFFSLTERVEKKCSTNRFYHLFFPHFLNSCSLFAVCEFDFGPILITT